MLLFPLSRRNNKKKKLINYNICSKHELLLFRIADNRVIRISLDCMRISPSYQLKSGKPRQEDPRLLYWAYNKFECFPKVGNKCISDIYQTKERILTYTSE